VRRRGPRVPRPRVLAVAAGFASFVAQSHLKETFKKY
jgi:hypothetical protein